MKKIKVLIADDEEYIRVLMRRAVKALDFENVGEAADGHETLALFSRNRPDVLLLDIAMPVKDGIEVLKTVKQKDPGSCVIMLTSHAESDKVRECIRLGADNYLRKDTPMSQIKQAIEATAMNSWVKKQKEVEEGKQKA